MNFYFWNGTSTFDCHFLGKCKSSFCSLFCNNITVNILGLHKNLMKYDKDEQKTLSFRLLWKIFLIWYYCNINLVSHKKLSNDIFPKKPLFRQFCAWKMIKTKDLLSWIWLVQICVTVPISQIQQCADVIPLHSVHMWNCEKWKNQPSAVYLLRLFSHF